MSSSSSETNTQVADVVPDEKREHKKSKSKRRTSNSEVTKPVGPHIILHHLESSRSQRILWLLHEMGLKYELKEYKRDPETHLAPPELKKIHPLGKSPLLEINGVVYAESAHIVQHLISKYGGGKFAPEPNTPEEERYNYWLHFAEGSAMPPLVMKLVFDVLQQKAPWIVKPIVSKMASEVNKAFLGPNLKANFEYMESELSKTKWFAGAELTGADILMSYPIKVHLFHV
jgi:glutathione S-transferase